MDENENQSVWRSFDQSPFVKKGYDVIVSPDDDKDDRLDDTQREDLKRIVRVINNSLRRVLELSMFDDSLQCVQGDVENAIFHVNRVEKMV